MIQKSALIIVVLAIFSLLYLRTTAVQQRAMAPKPTPVPVVREEKPLEPLDDNVLWGLIQDWRVRNGYKAYVRDSRLCVIAEKRVKEIQEDYSHTKFDNTDYSYLPKGEITENISLWIAGEENTLNGWLDSPSHRATLEKSYRSSCVATGGVYGQSAVQVFASF